MRELLKDYLTEKNLQVYQSEDYNEAKEILSLVLFDLIILDRMMPSGDGIELIEHIKQFSNTPIIMLTAMGEDKDKIDGLKKYYGAAKGDETLKFFEVHQSADIIHRQVIKELLGDVCDTEAKKEESVHAIDLTLASLNNFLTGMERVYC